MSLPQGWECPICHAIWSPMVAGCDNDLRHAEIRVEQMGRSLEVLRLKSEWAVITLTR